MSTLHLVASSSADPPPDECDDPNHLLRYYTEQMCKSVKRRSRVAGWSPSKAAAVVEQIQARQAAAAEKQELPPVPEATGMLLLLGQYGVKIAASLSFSHVHMLGCVRRRARACDSPQNLRATRGGKNRTRIDLLWRCD
jgi:hypothetical protein